MAETGIYNRFKANLMKKQVDLVNDTINVILLDTNHTFTATNTVLTDVSGNELPTAGGYTVGGQALDNLAVTEAATTKWDADDEAWGTTSTFTAHHAVIYDTSVSDNLIASIDFGGAKAVASGTFTIQWSADGIITLAE